MKPCLLGEVQEYRGIILTWIFKVEIHQCWWTSMFQQLD